MSSADCKTLARRVIEDVINPANLSLVDELFSRDYIYMSPGMPELHGIDGFRQLIRMYKAAFPDVRLNIDEQIAEGEAALTRWTGTGTHLGEFMGLAPTGRRVTVSGMILTRCAAGKIVSEYEILDTLGLLQQLGAIPATAANKATV